MSTTTPLRDAIEDLLVRDKQVEVVPASMRELYQAGERMPAIYYARAGMVKLSQDHGDQGLTLGVVCPGEIFGEEILLGYGAYRATALRITKGEILRIPSPLFQRMAGRHPELWRGVAALIDHRLVHEQRSYRRLVNASTDERIVAMLENLAPNCPLVPDGDDSERMVHGIPLTQAELAILVGASRETTSSALNAMERRGTLQLRRGRILVPPVMARSAHA